MSGVCRRCLPGTGSAKAASTGLRLLGPAGAGVGAALPAAGVRVKSDRYCLLGSAAGDAARDPWAPRPRVATHLLDARVCWFRGCGCERGFHGCGFAGAGGVCERCLRAVSVSAAMHAV